MTAFRPEGSLLYVNIDGVLEVALAWLPAQPTGTARIVACDPSSAPQLYLAAVGMLRKVHATVGGHAASLFVTGAHGRVRDLLRREGFAEPGGNIGRAATLEAVVGHSAGRR